MNNWKDYLEHKRSHKYLLKIGEGKDARYFYTQAEIDAYKQNQMISNSTNVDKNPTMRNQLQNKALSDATNIDKNPNADILRRQRARANANKVLNSFGETGKMMGKSANVAANAERQLPEGPKMLKRKLSKAVSRGKKAARPYTKSAKKVIKPYIKTGKDVVNAYVTAKRYWLG